jgi:hypothetical protein
MSQLNLFAAPAPAAPVVPQVAPPPATQAHGWPSVAGPVTVSLTIPAADLPWLREVVAKELDIAAALRKGWGLTFTPNLVVEAGEPDAAGQVVATVRATHFEGWHPTPESAAWFFRHRVRKEEAAA